MKMVRFWKGLKRHLCTASAVVTGILRQPLTFLFEGMDAETLRDDLLRMEVLRYRRLPYRQENTTGNLV